jgi:hypothetical protein
LRKEGADVKRIQTADAYPGINISKIPVGGGVAGLMIAVCIVVIALIGLPVTRWFLGGSLAVGLVAGLIRRWTARD